MRVLIPLHPHGHLVWISFHILVILIAEGAFYCCSNFHTLDSQGVSASFPMVLPVWTFPSENCLFVSFIFFSLSFLCARY